MAAGECPKCELPLSGSNSCNKCGGQQLGLNLISSYCPDGYLQKCLARVREEGELAALACPLCTNRMRAVFLPELDHRVELDFCLNCQSIWFDANEAKLLPKKTEAESVLREMTVRHKKVVQASQRRQDRNILRARRTAIRMLMGYFRY